MSADSKWDLSKPKISDRDVLVLFESLKSKYPFLDKKWLNKTVVFNCIYLEKIALKNYEKGGDIKVECEMYFECEDQNNPSIDSFYGSLAYYVFRNKTLGKAVKDMMNDCLIFKSYADDIRATAW